MIFFHFIGTEGCAIRRELILVFVTLLFLTAFGGTVRGQDGMISARVMFDFGDGVVRWGDAVLGDNRTATDATKVAAASLGLEVEETPFGDEAFITDIGDRNPAFPAYFHFLLWNGSSLDWEYSDKGSSAVTLGDGDIIGWFLSVDDPGWDFQPNSWPGPRPLATPTHPFPAVAFRGNLANSGATDSPAPTRFALQWRFDTGGGEIGASPVGALGKVYQVTLFNGTHALDLRNGTRLWTADVSGLSTPTLHREAGFVTVPQLGNRPRPADLVVASKDGALYRLDGGSGAVVWRTPIQEAGFTGIASSPKISGGRVIVGIFNESGGTGGLISVDVADGSIHWRRMSSSVHMSSVAIQEGFVYVGLMGFFNGSSLSWDPPHGLLSVHEADGTDRWMFPTSGPVASSPALVGDTLYFTTRDGYLYAVSTEGSLVFRTRIGPSTSSPAVGFGMVFAGSGVLGTGGNVTAFDLQGNQAWQFTPNGSVQSSLTLAGDHLIFATNTEVGTVYALNATSGEPLWTYVPEPHQYILPTPAVIDGLVVIASDNGFVYALGPIEPPSLAVGALAASVVLVAAIVVGVLVFLRARRRGAL